MPRRRAGSVSPVTSDDQDVSNDADAADDGSVTREVTRIVGERVRGLRGQRGLTMQQFADAAGISRAMLFKMEHGQAAASIATLAKVARAADVPLTALFRGLDEEHDAVLVKSGQGLEIMHEGSGPGRRYQDLGTLRGQTRAIEPVLITLTEPDAVFPLFQHGGVEFLHVLSGSLEYSYGAKWYLLEQGDTFQIHGEVAHGPHRLLELPVRFLSLKVYPTSE